MKVETGSTPSVRPLRPSRHDRSPGVRSEHRFPIGFPALLVAVLLGSGFAPGHLPAQDSNIHLPAERADSLLTHAAFEIPDTMRQLGHRSRLAILRFAGGGELPVKWAAAPRSGETFNNVPRYELAAYRLQRLFLDGPEYVVPPTAVRAVPLSRYPPAAGEERATFDRAESVLVLLQYFLSNVTADDVFDARRFGADPAYARNWANVNLLTHLIAHNDSNTGNLLLSRSPANPRVFAVDNGISFRSEAPSGEGRWRLLQVSRFPASTVERLRSLTEEGLHQTLGVLAQFEVRRDRLVRVEPTENLDPGRGIRWEGDVLQLGLSDVEIADVWRRLREFLVRVDRGRVELF